MIRSLAARGGAAPLLALLAALLVAAPVAAQAPTPSGSDPAAAPSGSRFGVGVQSSWPAYGVSALYDLNDRVTVQAVLGALGTVTTLSARGLYYLTGPESYRWFGYGTLGLWRHDSTFENETTLGFGGGGGMELDWRSLIGDDAEDFPPLFSTIEVGLSFADFEYYDWSALTWGVGFHYRF